MGNPVEEVKAGVLDPGFGHIGLQLFDGGAGLEQVALCQIGFGEQQEAAVGPFRAAAEPVELGKDGGLASGRIARIEGQGGEVVAGFFGVGTVSGEPLEVGSGLLRRPLEEKQGSVGPSGPVRVEGVRRTESARPSLGDPDPGGG